MMIVDNQLFGGDSPNGIEFAEFWQYKAKLANVHAGCAVRMG